MSQQQKSSQASQSRGRSNFHKSTQQSPNMIVSSAQIQNPLIAGNNIAYSVKENLAVDFFFPGISTGIIFLSLEYHYHSPLYISEKIDRLKNKPEFKEISLVILAVVMDKEDTNDYLIDLQFLRTDCGIQTMLFKTGGGFVQFLKNLNFQTQNKQLAYSFIKSTN